MIFDARGRPAPSPEITKRLAQIDPAFHLRFVEGPDRGWWALAQTWKTGDPRYQLIQRGDMHPDDNWDMLCQLPRDCTADEAYGFVVGTLKALAPTKQAAREMLNRVHLYNQLNVESVGSSLESVAEEEMGKLLDKKARVKVFQRGK